MTLAGPSTNSNQTITIPDATGTMMVSGNMPAFSAYSTATQNPSTAVVTKVIFGAELFDTANCFDTSNGRFTPNVAGYYQFNASVAMAADTNMTAGQLYFYKNGSGGNWPNYENTSQTGTGYQGTNCAALIYCNGTTDYVEVYAQVTGTGTLRYFFSSSAGHTTTFQGVLVRAA
jgi:hypothetical protein